MCLIVLAGILLRTSTGLSLIILSGLPFTWILKLLLPFTLILSSPSTVTKGTLRSISSTVLVFESGSSCTLYSILSISALTNGFWATISTLPNSLVASEVYKVPRSTSFSPDFTSKSLVTVLFPIEVIVITYIPGWAFIFSLKFPCISVTAIFTALSGAFFSTISIVA